MYCKICGASSTEGSNYCGHDGASLIESIPRLNVKKNQSTFCPSCGEKTGEQQNYCGACGASALTYDASNEPIRETTTKDDQIHERAFVRPRFQVSYLKKALIPAVIAFAFMLVLNIFAYQYAGSTFTDLFEDRLSAGGIQTATYTGDRIDDDMPKPDQLFGFSDMVMNSHLITPTYHLSSDATDPYSEENNTYEGKLHISFTFVIYILIPMLALFVGGLFAGRKQPHSSVMERLYLALSIGGIYGIILALFSLFSGFSYDVNMAKDAFHLKLDIHASYSFIKSLFIGLTVGTVLTFIGMLFSINYRQFTKQLSDTVPFGEVIHQAFSTFVRGIVIMSVIMMIAVLVLKDNLSDFIDFLPVDYLSDQSALLVAAAGTQAGSILLNLAHLVPLHIDNLLTKDTSLTFSIFGGLKGDELAELLGDFIETPFYLYFVFLLPIALFIWSGYKMKTARQGSLQNLAIYSIIYAILIGFMAYLTQMNFNLEDSKHDDPLNSFVGFSIFGSFIRAFIFSYIFAYVGGYIAKRKGY
ncbi:zinc ribbon domain-containing protein [Priestia koreensis]|uniref:Uncharacterized protein n=1 Tax=Priestia koreensis TaxID=284581 RepID=A0A0M0KEJ0_9BACI|nr:zinc ribbon domain-containing protein [Priestia koreensis]KOO37219.1 hypothetical protein AMD01_22345 [Priestia koreensis]